MSQSWKTKIDKVRSTYPAVDTIPQVIDDVKFRGRKSVDDSIEKVIKKWEEQYGRNFKEELSRGFSENDDNYRQAIEHGEERSSIYDDDVEHSGENKKVFGLGESKNSRRQNQLNTDESTLGGNENRQGNGTT